MISKKNAAIWTAIIAVTLCVATFLLTFYGVKNARGAAGEIYITAEQYQLLKDYDELSTVMDIVRDHYYKEVEDSALIEGAKAGLVDSLGDPYSVYYTSEEYAALYDKLDGVYTGVGIVISTDADNGLISVVYVYPDSPASDAGVQIGDCIIAVEGESIMGADLETAAEKMRGPDGTEVGLTLMRGDGQLEVSLSRRTVEMDKASYTMINAYIGYINIFEFTGNCVDVFKEAMETMKTEDVRALVIDIRNNPGGRLSSATEIADLLLPECDIVYTEDRDKNVITQTSDAECWDIPVVLLINGNSASASEVLAGALQDNGRATLVGTLTYGKGIVQDIISIPETGGGVKITTGTYFTPKGNAVHNVGITPDNIVESTGASDTIADDAQLQKAIELLTGIVGEPPEDTPEDAPEDTPEEGEEP